MHRLLAILVVAAAGLIVGGGDAPTTRAAPPGAPRVTLIGDSTLMAMDYYPNDDELLATTYDVNLQTGNCRRLVRPSCRVSGNPPVPSALAVMQTTARGQLGQVLVIMAGYDDFHDITGDIDAIVTEAVAQGVGEVLWLTYRESPTYHLPHDVPGQPAGAEIYAWHNDLLREATGRWPELAVLDWHAYSIGHPEWFSADGIHLRPSGSVELARFIKAALDARPLLRCDARNARTGTPDAAAAAVATAAEAAGFVPVEPTRVLDTRRADLGGASGMVGAGRTVTVSLAGVVPDAATAAVLSVAAVDPCATGYLTVFPCGPVPATSNVNYAIGRNTATMAVSMLGDSGDVCVFTSATADVVVDVLGAFAPGGAAFHPVAPTRWLDTRGAPALVTGMPGPLVTGTSMTVPVGGRGAVPDSAAAVIVNTTVAGATGATAISLRPGPCTGTPTTSVVNVSDGRDGAASAIVGLGSDGSLCATVFSGGGDLVLDVAGWFGTGAGGFDVRAATPERLLDTRTAGTRVPAGGTAALALDAPSLLSVAIIDTPAAGWAAVAPCSSVATSSLLNTVAGEPMANATAVAPDDDGAVCLSPSVDADFVVDRVGTFVARG